MHKIPAGVSRAGVFARFVHFDNVREHFLDLLAKFSKESGLIPRATVGGPVSGGRQGRERGREGGRGVYFDNVREHFLDLLAKFPKQSGLIPRVTVGGRVCSSPSFPPSLPPSLYSTIR